MAIRRKKIETMKVTLSQDSVSFCQVLNDIVDTNYNEDKGKVFSLHRIRENNDFFLGYMNTTKQIGIPPKHNPRHSTSEALPINETDGEGLGYSNVFVYDKTFQVIMYEFNQNGCYLGSFRRYVLELYNEGADEPLNVSFSPLLRLEALERILRFNVYKSLQVKIAVPSGGMQDFLDENDALSSAISTAQQLQSDTVDLKFDIKGRPINGMPSQVVSNLIRRVQRLINNYDERIVDKFVVAGYYHDIEEDVTKKDEIDFLTDRYLKTFSVDEPNILSDSQTREKSSSLFDVYINCRSDFEILAPIE